MMGLIIASAWLGFYTTPFLYALWVIAIPFVFADNISKMATKQTIANTTYNKTKSKQINTTKTSKSKHMLSKQTRTTLKYIILAIFIAVFFALPEGISNHPEVIIPLFVAFIGSMIFLSDEDDVADDKMKEMFDESFHDKFWRDDVFHSPSFSHYGGNIFNGDDDIKIYADDDI
jgi:hypothetical protein